MAVAALRRAGGDREGPQADGPRIPRRPLHRRRPLRRAADQQDATRAARGSSKIQALMKAFRDQPAPDHRRARSHRGPRLPGPRDPRPGRRSGQPPPARAVGRSADLPHRALPASGSPPGPRAPSRRSSSTCSPGPRSKAPPTSPRPRPRPRGGLTRWRRISNNTSQTLWLIRAERRSATDGHRIATGSLRDRCSSRAHHDGSDPARLPCREPQVPATTLPAEKVKTFPTTPGLYLMKDAQGRVIYVGKAKNLRARAGSYFHKTAAEDRRICDWIDEVADIDYLAGRQRGRRPADGGPADQGHPAQVQPRPQGRQDVPLPPDHHRRGLPPGQLHPRAARPRRQALRPVPAGQEPARGDPGAPADLQVPHLLAGHRGGRPALAVVPPLPAALDQPVHGPVQPADRPRDLPHATSAACGSSSTARRTSSSRRWRRRCSEASKALQFEKAARLRDEIKALQNLNLRGDLAKHAQPEVFYIDPRKGLKGLQEGARPRLAAPDHRRRGHRPPGRHARRSARW